MKAEIQDLYKLFNPEQSYRIPVFQRPYTWQKERQWEPLWNDVRQISERVMANSNEDFPLTSWAPSSYNYRAQIRVG